MKTCVTCRLSKPASEYYTGKNRCRPCMSDARKQWAKDNPQLNRARVRKSKYNITQDQFNQILSSQEGKCAVCRDTEPGGHGNWHVDHDHSCCAGRKSCGRCVRGLLCTKCNTALGLFKDSTSVLREAINYLEGVKV
jgi:hypothetical protein